MILFWILSALTGLILAYLGLAWWLGGKLPHFKPGTFRWRE